MKSIKILKSNVCLLTIDELHLHIKSFINLRKQTIIDYLNIYSANIAYENKWFSDFLNSCSLILCDGKGIQFAAYILGEPIPVQIPYNRWLWDFFEFCQNEKFSVFFLGAKSQILNSAIIEIRKRGFSFHMSGHHGYFNKNNEENELVISIINEFNPDILIVGFGMPLQERWVIENKEKLNTKIIILGGAYLDWLSGDVKLPPKFISNFGFEWLYRFVLEPRRLANRYLIGIPKFFIRVFYYKYF